MTRRSVFIFSVAEASPVVGDSELAHAGEEEHMVFMGRRGGLMRLGLAGLMAGLTLGCGKRAGVDPTKAVFEDFAKRVDQYEALRKQLADSVGPLDPTWDQAKITERATKLAEAIRRTRAGAKPGDIFTPEAATIIATLIKQEYDRRPDTVLNARGDAQRELPDFVPEVNQVYPTSYPLATFPATLLPLLPSLPKDLEYRIVSKYLILRDIEANVIIDLMPHAVPQERLR
jgi:hypothetical protein